MSRAVGLVVSIREDFHLLLTIFLSFLSFIHSSANLGY